MSIDPNNFAACILGWAQTFEVVPDVHPEDHIFRFLITNESFQSREDAIKYYFSDGQASSKKLIQLVSKFLKPGPSGDISILEFASGYGCVSRHLARLRGYQVTPCDIHPAAISFMSEKVDLNPLQSTHQPESFTPAKTYDVVFALSFFSHMPDFSWARWLAALFRTVRPGGILIFTTHGRISAKYFGDPTLDRHGYWFRAESEQNDLEVTEYGQTIVTPAYVFAKLSTLPEACPRFFEQAHWWKHQDVYVVQKTVGSASAQQDNPARGADANVQ